MQKRLLSSEGSLQNRPTARTPYGNWKWVRIQQMTHNPYVGISLRLESHRMLVVLVRLIFNSGFPPQTDNDFWFPMNPSACGTVPPCARGHSASYDPGSRSVFVYGGLREGQRFSDLYILDTLTWKWRLVTVGEHPLFRCSFHKPNLGFISSYSI